MLGCWPCRGLVDELTQGGRFRFGLFEANLRTRELLKDGRQVRIQEQPFQVLAALLERPQEMLSREELHRRVWPDDTFVDFENSLNVAVNRLREVLGDSASNPRFIETLPRRGYRFIAPVQVIGSTATPQRSPVLERNRAQKLAGWIVITVTAAVVVSVAAFMHTPRTVRVLRLSQLTNGKLNIPNNGGSLDSPLLTDGSRLYFSQMQRGHVAVQQIPVTGGEPVTIPSPFPDTVLFDISREGSELLVGSLDDHGPDAMQLWVIPASGGPPLRVGSARAGGAGWSPDASQIAYGAGPNLFVADRNGSNVRQLANFACDCSVFLPRWSPDSQRLRVTVENYANQTSTLWEMPPRGGAAGRVLPGWVTHHNRKGNWIADGKIFFFDDYDNAWAQTEETSFFGRTSDPPVQLTQGPLTIYSVIPNRDGSKLFAIGERSRGEVLRYDAESHRFEQLLDGISAEGLDYTRNGKWMTYVSFPDGALWRSRADGQDRIQLTSPPLRANLPRWSPDGSRIAFAAQLAGRPVNIYTVNADGSNLQPLPGTEWKIAPSWSPDGKALAYAVDVERRQLAIYNLETRMATTLSPDRSFLPVWSPDGRYILAATPDPPRLRLFELRTGRWTDLLSALPEQWVWSHDGNYIYLDYARAKNPSIQRIQLRDRRREKVADLAGISRSNGIFNVWFGLDPQDSPMVLRDLSSQQIYALDIQH
jgi:DNA-binding winged helix-turn-helix (wHTH) protein/Tol biopolymer transport system component